ncbi:MAG: HAD family phosphatase [Paracoccaceae bacterium]
MNIVFDIGNVLVRWDPHLAFIPDLGSRAAADDFLARIDFFALNLRCDGGETFSTLADEIADSRDQSLFRGYPHCCDRTIRQPIEGTWTLMEELRAAGHGIHAITNWSAETWPLGVATHPRLGTAFGVTVVSGREKMVKPDPRIFLTLCDRAGVTPESCLFIDDSPRNVEGARAVGMDAVHFTTPEALRAELEARDLLHGPA